MKKALVAIVLILTLSAAPARASESDLVGGAGAFTCAEFEKEYKRDPAIEHMFFTWAQGYMSGLNMAAGPDNIRELASKSFGAQEAFLREYCDRHALSTYAAGVSKLYSTLRIRH